MWFICILLFSLNSFVNSSFQTKTAEGIIGGYDATLGQFQYQVALVYYCHVYCGGGIIGDRFILTAAHCVMDTLLKFIDLEWAIVAGVIQIDKETCNRNQIYVEKMYVPKSFVPAENYNGDPATSMDADLVVLKLEKSLKLNENANKLKYLELPKPSDASLTYHKENPIIAGFGCNTATTNESNDQNTIFCRYGMYLKFAVTYVISKKKCQDFYDNIITDRLICARIEQRDPQNPEGVWKGDSGSPLVLQDKTLIGILSSTPTNPNKLHKSAIYTKVAHFLPFIQKAMNNIVSGDIRTATVRISKTLFSTKRILKED